MQHLQLQDPTRLKTILEAMNALIDDLNVSIDQHGVILRGMNSSNTSLTDAFIHKDNLDEFEFNLNENDRINFAIELDKIVKILARSKPGDKLRLEIVKDGLNIIITGDYKKTYTMGVKEFNEKFDKLPRVTFSNTLEADPPVLKELVDDLKLVTNKMIIIVKDKQITIEGKDEDKTKGTLIEFLDKPIFTVLNSDEDVRVKYSFDMFDRLVAILKGSDGKVIIDIGNKMPMRLQYDVKKLARVHHYTAPFIDED